MSVLWAVSVGLLGGAAVLFGFWLRGDRRDADRGSVRISQSWIHDAGPDLAGLREFVSSAAPGSSAKRRRALDYSPPSSRAEITAEFPAPY